MNRGVSLNDGLNRMIRNLKDYFSHYEFSYKRTNDILEHLVIDHTYPLEIDDLSKWEYISSLISNIFIRPNEVFSLWKLLKEDENICHHTLSKFVSIMHHLILESDLDIIELHHNQKQSNHLLYDIQVMFNHFDYRFINKTYKTYQLLFEVDDNLLKSQLRVGSL